MWDRAVCSPVRRVSVRRREKPPRIQERREEIERTGRALERRRRQFEAQLTALRTEFEAEEEEFIKHLDQAQGRGRRFDEEKREMTINRQAPLRPETGE